MVERRNSCFVVFGSIVGSPCPGFFCHSRFVWLHHPVDHSLAMWWPRHPIRNLKNRPNFSTISETDNRKKNERRWNVGKKKNFIIRFANVLLSNEHQFNISKIPGENGNQKKSCITWNRYTLAWFQSQDIEREREKEIKKVSVFFLFVLFCFRLD